MKSRMVKEKELLVNNHCLNILINFYRIKLFEALIIFAKQLRVFDILFFFAFAFVKFIVQKC